MMIFALIVVVVLSNDGAAAAAHEPRIERRPPTQSEVFDYVERLIALDDFRSVFTRGRDKPAGIRRDTVRNGLNQVHGYLDTLDDSLVAYVYNYVRNKLIEYCDVAIYLLNSRRSVEFFIETVKFEYDPDDFCVLAFLSDSKPKCPVRAMFSLMTFLQTLSYDPENSHSAALFTEIRKLRDGLNVYFDYEEKYFLADQVMGIGRRYNDCESDDKAYQMLSENKTRLKSLSKTLCSPNAMPIVDETFFSSVVKINVLGHNDDFIDYTLLGEKCRVQATRQQLQSGEGGDAPPPRHGSIAKGTAESEDNLFTLLSLRKVLRSHMVGVDVLSYNEIEGKAVAYAAAKEGYKMLRTAYDIVKRGCEREADERVARTTFDGEILFVRSRLFALKSVFTKLSDEILNELRVNVDEYPLSEFTRWMDNLLIRLSVREEQGEQFVKFLCNQINRKFLDFDSDMHHAHDDFDYENLVSCEYNFIGPLLNIYKLFEFMKSRSVTNPFDY